MLDRTEIPICASGESRIVSCPLRSRGAGHRPQRTWRSVYGGFTSKNKLSVRPPLTWTPASPSTLRTAAAPREPAERVPQVVGPAHHADLERRDAPFPPRPSPSVGLAGHLGARVGPVALERLGEAGRLVPGPAAARLRLRCCIWPITCGGTSKQRRRGPH